MLYLSGFDFPSGDAEWEYRLHIKESYYNTIYPFYVLPQIGMSHISFKPITILYGGNGSGKSTILNIIAEKLKLKRDSAFNRSSFFDDYIEMCDSVLDEVIPSESRIITSDDVFDFMLSLRALNDGIDSNRGELVEEYQRMKHDKTQLRSLADYDFLKARNDARRMTKSKYIKGRLQPNIREQSNGESSDYYFKSRIANDCLYLLDEPENSLSPENQKKLAAYLSDSVRFCGCQLILSTHSPFLLSLPGAKIIDLDNGCAEVENWADLKNVRVLYDFFKANESRFK